MNKREEIASGSSISEELLLFDKVKGLPTCFAAWVVSYDDTKGTATVLPAIKAKTTDFNLVGAKYENRPIIANVWVVGNAKETAPQKGDKAICWVLDEKSNDFFKAEYDENLPLEQQTFTPKGRKRTADNCCAYVLG